MADPYVMNSTQIIVKNYLKTFCPAQNWNHALILVVLSMVLTLEDVIGYVIACEDLNMYDKNAKSGKKKSLTLVDHEGSELQCTLWSAFAQQFNDFLNTCADHGKIIWGLLLLLWAQSSLFMKRKVGETTASVHLLRLSDDPEILDSIRLAVTPIKMDTEATSA
ncbi:replication protein A 70 kDa DNA-binding subunit B [Tanacetum coccineum]